MNSRKHVVAERKGINDPQASCFSGLWLRVTVASPFVISKTDRTEVPEQMDSKDNVRIRGRKIGERDAINFVSAVEKDCGEEG